MKQSRRMSLCESCTKTAVGYATGVLLQMLVFPMFGYEPQWSAAFGMTAIFAGWSIILGYCVRRSFERIK